MTYLHPFKGQADADTFLKASTNIKMKTWHLVEECPFGKFEYKSTNKTTFKRNNNKFTYVSLR